MNKRSQQLQSQAERLALENDRMEQRLQELRESLRKQKHERDAKGGYTWKAGRRSRISGHANAVIEDAQERRRKRAQGGRRHGRSGAKQLPRPPPGGPPQSGKENGSRRRMPQPPTATPDLSVGSATSTSTRGAHQGQPRPSEPASDLGIDARRGSAPQPAVQSSRQRRFKRDSFEASSSSSTAASQGGTRIDDWRQQTAMAMAGDVEPSPRASASASASAGATRTAAATTTTTATTATAVAGTGTVAAGTGIPDDYPPLPAEGGGRLLQGPAFDEEESSKAFAEAVKAWRTGGDAPTTGTAGGSGGGGVGGETHAATTAAAERRQQKAGTRAWNPSSAVAAEMTSTDTQAGAGEASPSKKVDLDIKFESNLSYLERLMLQKKRNNASSNASSKAASTSASPAPPRHTSRTSLGNSSGGGHNDATHADTSSPAHGVDDGALVFDDKEDDPALDTDFLQRRIKRWSVTDGTGTGGSEGEMRVELQVADVTDEGGVRDGDDAENATAAVVAEPGDVVVAEPTVVEPDDEDDSEDEDGGSARVSGRAVAVDAMQDLMSTQ